MCIFLIFPPKTHIEKLDASYIRSTRNMVLAKSANYEAPDDAVFSSFFVPLVSKCSPQYTVLPLED
jgi:hypothetical protein